MCTICFGNCNLTLNKIAMADHDLFHWGSTAIQLFTVFPWRIASLVLSFPFSFPREWGEETFASYLQSFSGRRRLALFETASGNLKYMVIIHCNIYKEVALWEILGMSTVLIRTRSSVSTQLLVHLSGWYKHPARVSFLP